MDAISDFALFRAIVDAGGISAASLLQSSPAAVSRRLTALEAKLGVRLADRSSRRFRLTDEGLLLYERSRFILSSRSATRRPKSPLEEALLADCSGLARSSDFGRRHVGRILALFTAQHLGLEAHLVLSDAGLENQADACDLVLRFGLPNDPGMIARRLR